MESEEVEQTIINEETEDHEVNVIPVQLIRINRREDVTTVASIGAIDSNSSNANLVRGKYYKQTYRPAWEQMPDFKGWLRGVEGEPTRAYCTYCRKTLHAHRLSLLKHTCTIRHQKAAQIHNTKKMKPGTFNSQDIQNAAVHEETVSHEISEESQIIEYTECDNLEDEVEQDTELEQYDDDTDEGSSNMDFQPVSFQKNLDQNQTGSGSNQKPPISTQVTDTTKGCPVSGLSVSLYKLIDGRWTYINEGVTSNVGKFSQFLDRADFNPGRYKLHFDVDRYFEAKKQDSLYPFIEVVFDSANYADNYQVTLLLSPHGYTVYKGQ